MSGCDSESLDVTTLILVDAARRYLRVDVNCVLGMMYSHVPSGT